PVGAALTDPRVTVELIADGVHLHPDVLALVGAAAGDQMVAVTDAMPATGLEPGRYELGGLGVVVDADRAVLADAPQTLAGSGLDIGGTHSRARLARDGETLAEAKAGSASLTAAGATSATAALQELLADLDLSSLGPLDAICAGSAGSGSPEAVKFLHSHLAP